jgi:hypothetical protein
MIRDRSAKRHPGSRIELTRGTLDFTALHSGSKSRRVGHMPPVVATRPRWGALLASVRAQGPRRSAIRRVIQINRLGNAKRGIASPIARMQWFRAPVWASRDRMTFRVKERTACDNLFQSRWRPSCFAPGRYPHRPITRAPRESTGLFGRVFPRVGRRFVRSAIMRVAAPSGAGVSPLERSDVEIRKSSKRTCPNFEISKADAIRLQIRHMRGMAELRPAVVRALAKPRRGRRQGYPS